MNIITSIEKKELTIVKSNPAGWLYSMKAEALHTNYSANYNTSRRESWKWFSG